MSAREKFVLHMAPPYDDALIQRIEEGFSSLLGFDVRFEVSESPALLCGFVAFVRGVVYDMSGKTHLATIQQHLLDSVLVPVPASNIEEDES